MGSLNDKSWPREFPIDPRSEWCCRVPSCGSFRPESYRLLCLKKAKRYQSPQWMIRRRLSTFFKRIFICDSRSLKRWWCCCFHLVLENRGAVVSQLFVIAEMAAVVGCRIEGMISEGRLLDTYIDVLYSGQKKRRSAATTPKLPWTKKGFTQRLLTFLPAVGRGARDANP